MNHKLLKNIIIYISVKFMEIHVQFVGICVYKNDIVMYLFLLSN